MADEIGPECTKCMITTSMLFTSKSLPEVSSVTNALILELVKFKDRHQCTFKVMCKDLYGNSWPQQQAPTTQAITKSIERLCFRLEKLKKQHTGVEKEETISDFLRQVYTLPSIGLYKGKVQHYSPLKVSSRIVDAEKSQELKKSQEKMYSATWNANKRLKRRDALILQQKAQIASQVELMKKN